MRRASTERILQVSPEEPQAALPPQLRPPPCPEGARPSLSETELLLCLHPRKTSLQPKRGLVASAAPEGFPWPAPGENHLCQPVAPTSSSARRCQVETFSCSGERLFWVVTASEGSRFIYLPSG